MGLAGRYEKFSSAILAKAIHIPGVAHTLNLAGTDNRLTPTAQK